MRTVTTTTNIYKFDELSDEAREKFTDESRDVEAKTTLDELVDCMKSAMDEMGIHIKDYSISMDGSGYIKLKSLEENLEGIRAYKYIVNNFFSGADKKKIYYLKDWSKRRESNLDRKDWMDSCPFSGICYDCAVRDAWESWCNELKEGNNPSVRDFLGELEWAYLKEQSDFYYGFSEELARELAYANDYEFLEDGTIY